MWENHNPNPTESNVNENSTRLHLRRYGGLEEGMEIKNLLYHNLQDWIYHVVPISIKVGTLNLSNSLFTLSQHSCSAWTSLRLR